MPADNLTGRVQQRIFAPLAQLRRRCRLYLALDGFLQFAAALIAAGLAQMTLDRWLRLSLDQRAFLTVAITVFLSWMLYRWLLMPLMRPPADRWLAMAVDRAHPELHDYIATAVQFAAGQVGDPEHNSPRLVHAVLDDACTAASKVSFLAVLDHRKALRKAVELVGLIVVTGSAYGLAPELIGTWFARNWLVRDIPWPQRTYIDPVGFDPQGRRRVPRGDELEIEAKIRGEVPTRAVLSWWTPSDRRGREDMTLVGHTRFELSLGVLTEDVHFRIVGGDERTREFVVQASERPRVVRTLTRITPPRYTGMAPFQVEQQTVFEVLKGAVVEIEAWLNKPVTRAAFVGLAPVADCERVAADHVRVSWTEPASGTYHFHLVDADGWDNRRPVRYTFKVVPDLPPGVRMELAGVGDIVTPHAELPIEVRFDDAYGLGSVALHVQEDQEPALAVGLHGFEPGRREFRTTLDFAVATVRAAPGDRLRLWAQAADADPAGPNVGRIEPVELRVVTREEFLAEMVRRELELRREFERLTSAQRGLNDALERVLPRLHEQGVLAAPAQRLAGLARRQDAHAGRCLVLRRRFEQMLVEMRISKVARSEDELRIAERVAAPLDRLGRESMPAASAAIADLRHSPTPDRRQAVQAGQRRILRQMEAVLEQMVEWEGYREVLELLREIIARQTDLRDATIDALKEQLDEILGVDQAPESPTPKEPTP